VLAAIAVIHFARHFRMPRVDVPAGTVYAAAPGEDAFAEMRMLFWNPRIERVATFDGGPAPDGFPVLHAALQPDGSITDGAGGTIRGPFLAGPETVADPASNRVFSAPVDALAFGWNRDRGTITTHARFLVAGRAKGTTLRLLLWTNRGPTTVEVLCDGRRQRGTAGASPVSFLLRARPGATETCDLYPAGSVHAGLIDDPTRRYSQKAGSSRPKGGPR
jgi:hypothetical protein